MDEIPPPSTFVNDYIDSDEDEEIHVKKQTSTPSKLPIEKIELKDVKIEGFDKIKKSIYNKFIARNSPKYRDLYNKINSINNVLLLYGLPGTGKTELAKYMAFIAGMDFYSVDSTLLVSSKVGASEKNLKEV